VGGTCTTELRIYLLAPFTSNDMGVVLMHNCGCPLQDVGKFQDPKSIVQEFEKVIQTASFLVDNGLPHGDVLPHNLVYNKETCAMSLIDIDEGVGQDDRNTLVDHNITYIGLYAVAADCYISLFGYKNGKSTQCHPECF
jgi:RIO-like serine/threonine protein kinase